MKRKGNNMVTIVHQNSNNRSMNKKNNIVLYVLSFILLCSGCDLQKSIDSDKYTDYISREIMEKYENGNIKGELIVLNDSIKVILKYYENGQLDSETIYLNDLLNEQFLYYESGELEIEVLYSNNVKIKDNAYYETGELKTKIIVINDSVQYVLYYAKNGNLESESFMSNDTTLNGLSSNYYNNGQLKSQHQFKQGVLHGFSKYWTEEGFLYHVSYRKNGLLDSTYEEWYPTGEVLSKGTFKEGTGYLRYYHKNGKMQKEGKLVNNKEEGVWEYYDENGKKSNEYYYKDGIELNK